MAGRAPSPADGLPPVPRLHVLAELASWARPMLEVRAGAPLRHRAEESDNVLRALGPGDAHRTRTDELGPLRLRHPRTTRLRRD